MPAPSAHDAELELAVGDAVDDGLSVGDREPNSQLRVLFLELAEQQRNDGPARACGSPKVERAGERALVALGQLFEETLLEGEQPLGRGVEAQPGLGRLDAPAGSVEKPAAEALLERPDLQADRRLSDTEPLSGLRKALSLDHRAERCQLTRIHKPPLCKRSGPVRTRPRQTLDLEARVLEI